MEWIIIILLVLLIGVGRVCYWAFCLFLASLLLWLILIAVSQGHAADPWTKGDTIRESTWQVIHALDFMQTRQIARHPETWRERNPFLGEHPSAEKVMVYFACGAVLHLGIAYLLPKDYREAFQYVTILFSAGVVATNFGVGLNFQF